MKKMKINISGKMPLNIIRLIAAGFFCLLSFTNGFAQVSEGGQPYSFSEEFRQSQAAARASSIPEVVVPAPNMAQVYYEDSVNGWNRDGVHMPLAETVRLINSGQWIELENGDRVWRVKLSSEKAEFLHPIFEEFYLPIGATLFVYDCERREIQGGYTYKNNRPSRSFYTGPERGNCIIIEYYEPLAVKGEGSFEIPKVTYGYSSKKKGSSERINQSYGDAQGACHKNINCPEGSSWQDEKRGVVRIRKYTSQGSFGQSGSLVNNTRLDGKQYLLTSYHGPKATTQEEFDRWRFYFNYEEPGCEDTGTAPEEKTVLGAISLAKGTNSDFHLLEISGRIPASYNVYYNGWDAETLSPANSGVGIHHPQADVKKISVENNPIISYPEERSWEDGSTSAANTHWAVAFDVGGAERGSSGSPFFNSSSKIVGQLHAAKAISDCHSDVFDEVFYGKFNVSWEGDGTSVGSLKSWLDPVGGGTTKTLAGAYLSSWSSLEVTELVSPSESFTADDEIIIRIENKGPTAIDFSANSVDIVLLVEYHFNDGSTLNLSMYEQLNSGVLNSGQSVDKLMGPIAYDDVNGICISSGTIKPGSAGERNLAEQNSEAVAISGAFPFCLANNQEDLVVSFSANKTAVDVGEEIDFSSEATGSGPFTYSWNFGSGASPVSSTSANPTGVSYTTTGGKNVSLTISNATTSKTVTKSKYIFVDATPIMIGEIASCSNSTYTDCGNSFDVGQTVYFRVDVGDPSTVSNFMWNFGDGNTYETSSSTTFHSYSSSGTYSVACQVTDIYGQTAFTTLSIQINTVVPYIEARFDISDTYVSTGDGPVVFTDASESNIDLGSATYYWDFGEGAYPRYAYSKGPHEVCYNSIQASKNIYMSVNYNNQAYDQEYGSVYVAYDNLSACNAFDSKWVTNPGATVIAAQDNCNFTENIGVNNGDFESIICDFTGNNSDVSTCAFGTEDPCFSDTWFSSHGTVRIRKEGRGNSLMLWTNGRIVEDGSDEHLLISSEGLYYQHPTYFKAGENYRFSFYASTLTSSGYIQTMDHLKLSLASDLLPNTNCENEGANFALPGYDFNHFELGSFNYSVTSDWKCFVVNFVPPNDSYNQIWLFPWPEESLLPRNQIGGTQKVRQGSVFFDDFSLRGDEDCATEKVVSQNNLALVNEANYEVLTSGTVEISPQKNLTGVVFKAGGSITLKPGFTVKGGSEFEAKIGACSNDAAGRTVADEDLNFIANTFIQNKQSRPLSLEHYKLMAVEDEEPNLAFLQDLIVFPNPTEESSFTLKATLEKSLDVEIRIFSVDGYLMEERILLSVQEIDQVFNTEEFSPGVYFIQVKSKSRVSYSKIVIQ